MTSDLLAALAGILLSLIASYVPGFSPWFKKLDSTQKRAFMAAALLGISLAAFGLSCAQVIDAVECSRDGALVIVHAFVAALVANQSAFMLSPTFKTADGKG